LPPCSSTMPSPLSPSSRSSSCCACSCRLCGSTSSLTIGPERIYVCSALGCHFTAARCDEVIAHKIRQHGAKRRQTSIILPDALGLKRAVVLLAHKGKERASTRRAGRVVMNEPSTSAEAADGNGSKRLKQLKRMGLLVSPVGSAAQHGGQEDASPAKRRPVEESTHSSPAKSDAEHPAVIMLKIRKAPEAMPRTELANDESESPVTAASSDSRAAKKPPSLPFSLPEDLIASQRELTATHGNPPYPPDDFFLAVPDSPSSHSSTASPMNSDYEPWPRNEDYADEAMDTKDEEEEESAELEEEELYEDEESEEGEGELTRDVSAPKRTSFRCIFPNCSYSHVDEINFKAHELEAHFSWATEAAADKASNLVVKDAKNDNWECLRCTEGAAVFYSSFALTEHLLIAHNFDCLKDVKCQKCDFVAENQNDFVQHFKFSHLMVKEQEQAAKKAKINFTKVQKTPKASSRRRKCHSLNNGEEHLLFPCQFCIKTFKNSSRATFHMRNSHPEAMTECALCGKKFPSKEAVEAHKVGSHFRVPCSRCHESFDSNRTLQKHELEVHKGEVPLMCDQCGKTFPSTWALRSHIALCIKYQSGGYKDAPLMCDQCGKAFRSTSKLCRHAAACVTGSQAKCTFCEEKFATTEDRVRHMEEVHQDMLNCDSCGRSFQAYKTFRNHSSICRRKKAGLYSDMCSICGKRFLGKKKLQDHMEIHHSQVKCSVCGVEVNSGKLILHKMLAHPDICDTCGLPNYKRSSAIHDCPGRLGTGAEGQEWLPYIASYLSETQNNIVKLDKGMGHACVACGVKMGSGPTAQKHYWLMHQVQTCHICFHAFPNCHLLRMHITEAHRDLCSTCGGRVVEGEQHSCLDVVIASAPLLQALPAALRPVRCPLDGCGAVIASQKNMFQHKRDTHAEGERVVCTVCNKEYKTVRAMYLHKKHVHSEKSHPVCPFCLERKDVRHLKRLSTECCKKYRSGQPLLCPFASCDFAAVHLREYSNHARMAHFQEPFPL